MSDNPCDLCGSEIAVTTDVWLNDTPVTACQACILRELTAEQERLGLYADWSL